MIKFKSINQVVAAGSADGVLTSAALLRIIGNPDADIVFTQAFTVDKIDMSAWKPERKVAFVDLSVNNSDKKMTADFVQRIRSAGHEIVAVCDEHNREDWLEALGGFGGLVIEPQSQDSGPDAPKSSGRVLMNLLVGMQKEADAKADGWAWSVFDGHTQKLLEEADRADRMDFVGYGEVVNMAVKSKIADDTRRVYLARHFAQKREPDETIRGWVKEYQTILQNHWKIIAARQDLGDGIVRISSIGVVVDMTTLMKDLYDRGARISILECELFDKAAGKKSRIVSIGTNEKIDILAAVKVAVPSASGFAKKANVAPEYEEAAVAAVRQLLKG